MRNFSILAAVICFSLMSFLAHAQKKIPHKKILLITNLVKNSPLSLKNPSEYCLEDNYLYEGARYRANDLNLFINQATETDLGAHQFVMIKGSVHRNLFEKLTRKKECPPNYGENESSQQIRSDWVSDETGFTVGRSTTEKLKSILYLEAEEITPFSGFTLRKEKDKKSFKAVFTNTLKVPVHNLEIVAHYESHGFGKPMPYYITKKFPVVKPGQRATYVIPGMQEDPGSVRERKKKYRFHSVEARSASQGMSIHLELFNSTE